MAKILTYSQLKYCQNSQFLRGNWLLFKKAKKKNSIIQGKDSKLKTKTQGFRQSQTRGLPQLLFVAYTFLVNSFLVLVA